jgi:TrpR-related protein YerC/YecD
MSKRRFTDDSWRKEPWFRSLCTVFLSCKTEEEIGSLIRDVATLSEMQALSERLEVAKQLAQGKTYREIAVNTGASTTTVTRVAKFLENGEGGYRKALNAHRHHRMVSSMPQHSPHAEATASPQHGERPVSVLQKYLERASEEKKP